MPEPAPLALSSLDSVGFFLPVSFSSTVISGMNYANLRYNDEVMSRSHGIKGVATNEVFQALQEQPSLWDRAPVGLLNLQDLLHAQEPI